MNLPKQWIVTNNEQAKKLKAELILEVIPGHLMFGKDLEVVARHEWTDDILCRHLDSADLFTVVHLTNRGGPEINKDWPSVEFNGSFNDFLDRQKKVTITLNEKGI